MKQSIVPLALVFLLSASLAGHAQEPISLAGQWRFGIATNAAVLPQTLPAIISLPGTMDDAGFGPKNTNTPTLEGPYRLHNYAGPAWYERDIEIPSDWKGKHVTLFLERCRWVTTVWLDGQRIGSQDSLIAPHIYDFGTELTPGKHRLTICVDNTDKINLGKFVSALRGGTWGDMNGIVGRIELAATPPVWIESVQVYPNAAKKTALVKVRIGNATGKSGEGEISLGDKVKVVKANWTAAGGDIEVELDLSGAKLWDEFSPNLSHLTVKLGDDQKIVSFGLRDLSVKGTKFTMNGRTLFLRGTLECSVFPLTGTPPTDVEAWRKIFQIEKSYGLNFVRFHSWCPPEAAFEAADLEGIMIQAEGPQANVDAGKDAKRDEFIEAEFKRIVDTYGNHPSFCLMTLGNEYGGTDAVLSHWVGMLIQRDPRHLYSSASSAQTTDNRQWTERGTGAGDVETLSDAGAVVATDSKPIVSHELGQHVCFPNLNEIKKWTGVMSLKNYEMIRDDLAKKNLLDLASKFVDASGRQATILYKSDIESKLRTAGLAGFSLLDLHDYPTQGTALVGLLDSFWDSKGCVTPEAFRQFCGPVVPLLRMPKRTYSSEEPLVTDVELANYGPTNLTNALPVWTIRDEGQKEIASGQLPPVDAPTGQLTHLGEIRTPLAKTDTREPHKLKVSIALQGTEIVNTWDIWVYPQKASLQPPSNVTVCQNWSEAKAALAEGKRVLFFPSIANPSLSMPGRFKPVFWSPVWFPYQRPNTMGLLLNPQHPLYATFPTDNFSDWQWCDLMQHSTLFVLDETPATYRPLAQIVDNFARNHKLGVIFEGRVGKGSLLVCGLQLQGQPKNPAAMQMLASLYEYAGSEAFHPAQTFGDTFCEKLFTRPYTNFLRANGATVKADGQDSDYVGCNAAANALDSDPLTAWQTSGKKYPHELVIELPKPMTLHGLKYLPRQNPPTQEMIGILPGRLGNFQNGRIKDYAVYVSDDGKNWIRQIAQGKFNQGLEWQTIAFAHPETTRYLKFVALNTFTPTSLAAVAELDAY